MNTVNLKITGVGVVNPVVCINGDNVKLKKSQFGEYVCSYRTESPSARIQAFTLTEVSGRFWFLTQFLFFIISLLGIFDAHRGKHFKAVDCDFSVVLTKNTAVMLKFNKFGDKQRAAEIETIGAASDDGNAVMETANYYYVDETLKKRYKILKTVKILTWVAVLIAAAAILIIKIFL